MATSCAYVDGCQSLICARYITLEAVSVMCILSEAHVYRLDKHRSYSKIAPHLESHSAIENIGIHVVCAQGSNL